jgi:hypothetical protein
MKNTPDFATKFLVFFAFWSFFAWTGSLVGFVNQFAIYWYIHSAFLALGATYLFYSPSGKRFKEKLPRELILKEWRDKRKKKGSKL